jgi:hypothetical protein
VISNKWHTTTNCIKHQSADLDQNQQLGFYTLVPWRGLGRSSRRPKVLARLGDASRKERRRARGSWRVEEGEETRLGYWRVEEGVARERRSRSGGRPDLHLFTTRLGTGRADRGRSGSVEILDAANLGWQRMATALCVQPAHRRSNRGFQHAGAHRYLWILRTRSFCVCV